MRTGIYSGVSIAAVLVFTLAGGDEFTVYVAAALALAGAIIVFRRNRGRTWTKALSAFFLVAAAHDIYGYWAAGSSTDAIAIGSNAGRLFRSAMLVIAATLFTAAVTYDAVSRLPAPWADRFGRKFHVSDNKLVLVARWFVVLGSLCILYVVINTGFMPILASDPGTARYIADALGPSYKLYDWILHRGLDLLTWATPLVLLSALILRRRLDWLLGGGGVLGILITLERAYLLSVFVVLLLTVSYFIRRFPRKYLVFLALLVAAYYGSQLVFLRALSAEPGTGTFTTALLSALPEVRDLGWTMSLAGDRRLYGATFIVPLLVGPGIATNFKTHYGLGYVTIHLAGYEGEATGGLRITLAGEGYLNFGVVGCLVIGVVFGYLCAALAKLTGALLKKRNLASSYLVSAFFTWLCFWLYLGGTANAEPIRNGMTSVLMMFLLARVRRHENATVPPALSSQHTLEA